MPFEQVRMNAIKREVREQLYRMGARARGSMVLDDCVESLEAQERMVDYGNTLAVSCAMSILTERLGVARAPRDWWEAFRERWFPKFLLRRFPVKYSYFDLKALYPDPTSIGCGDVQVILREKEWPHPSKYFEKEFSNG